MAKYRNTIQMIKILNYLKSVKTHPNAEMVFKKIKKDIPSITLATVYRNLNKLESQGQIVKIEVNGEFRFDADISFHQHCICITCATILDSFDEKISKNALKSFSSKKFKPSSVQIIFHGLCEKCK